MINSILTLAEYLRSLAQRKSELDKEYFQNFIRPIWELFSDIHKNYKETISDYQSLVARDDDEASNKVFDSFVETLKRDSILSSDLRSELKSLMKNLPHPVLTVNELHLSNFVNSILDYFLINKDARQGMHELTNIRATVYDALARLRYISSDTELEDYDKNNLLVTEKVRLKKFQKGELVKTKLILETSMKHIQLHYSKVADAYYLLKKELLT